MVKNEVYNSIKTEHVKHGSNGTVIQESSTSHDELLQMFTQLKLENDFLKSKFEELKNPQSEDAECSQQTGISEQDANDVKKLLARIDALNKELLEEKQTRSAAEEALKHLRTMYSEADARAQELSTKLAEGPTFTWTFEYLLISSF